MYTSNHIDKPTCSWGVTRQAEIHKEPVKVLSFSDGRRGWINEGFRPRKMAV